MDPESMKYLAKSLIILSMWEEILMLQMLFFQK
jgi:hypothetical protein